MRYSNVFINAIGYELPPNVVTSEDLEARLAALYEKFHFKPGQLEAMTGIYERRFWDPGYRVSDGSIAAGRKAIEASGIDPREFGMLIYGGSVGITSSRPPPVPSATASDCPRRPRSSTFPTLASG